MPYNFPVEIEAAKSTGKWTVGRTIEIKFNEIVLKNVKIWFSRGCSGKVYVRIKLNNGLFLPNQSGGVSVTPDDTKGYGPAYFGDDNTWPIHTPHTLRRGDKLTIEYINSDNSNSHQIGVHFEMVIKPANKEIDTEGTGTGLRDRRRVEMKELNQTTNAVQNSVRSPKGDRNPLPVGDIEREEYKGMTRAGKLRPKAVYKPRYD